MLVKLQPYYQVSIHQERFSKLSKRFYGLFKVLRKIGEVAYEIESPQGAKIHNVFHISVMKKVIGQFMTSLELPKEVSNSHPFIQPLAILDSRRVWQ